MNFSIYPENKIKLYKDKILKHFSNLKFSENNNVDLIFIFGGDGTFLKALKKHYNQSVKLILINEGKIGFISSIDNSLASTTRDTPIFDNWLTPVKLCVVICVLACKTISE